MTFKYVFRYFYFSTLANEITLFILLKWDSCNNVGILMSSFNVILFQFNDNVLSSSFLLVIILSL